MGWSSDGKEGESDGKEGSKDGGTDTSLLWEGIGSELESEMPNTETPFIF